MLIVLETWQNYTRSRGCGTKGMKYSIMLDVLARWTLWLLKMVRFTSLMLNTTTPTERTTLGRVPLSKRN